MSDPAPRRVIGGLTPVAGVPSALERMRGGGTATTPAKPQETANVPETAPATSPAATAATPASDAVSAPQGASGAGSRPRSRQKAPRAAQRPSVAAEQAPKDQITTYIARPTRARARAAFKATGHLEGDESFSAFVERAIVNELERREKAYNGGKPYAGDGGRLTPGRPLQ